MNVLPSAPVIFTGPAVSVADHGAKGDGRTDATAAFLAAIAAAKSQGLPVCVPGGSYVPTATLPLDGVSLWGDPRGSWPADATTQPALLFNAPTLPCIRIQNATLSGLCIRTSGGPDAAPTVSVEGDEVTVSNCKLFSSAQGIVTAVNGIRGLIIEDVFMPDPQHIGVKLAGTRGRTVVRNVEAWPSTIASVPFAQNGVGFWLQDNEDVVMEDCFVWNASRAILLEEADGRGNRVYMDNCSVDFCGTGLVICGTHDVTVEGGTFWDHYTGVQLLTGKTRLSMRGMDLKSNGAPVMEIRAAGAVRCESLILRRVMDDREVPVLSVLGGEDISFVGCSIAANCHAQPAVYIETPGKLSIRHSVVSHPDRFAFSPTSGNYDLDENTVTPLT